MICSDALSFICIFSLHGDARKTPSVRVPVFQLVSSLNHDLGNVPRQLSRRSATFLAPSPSIPLSKNQLEALISLCYTLDQTARREILEQMLYRGTSLWSEGVVDCFVLQLFTAWLPNPCRGDAEKQRELDRKRVHAMFKAQGGGLKYAVATARQQSALGGGSGGQPFFSTTPAPAIAAQWCKRPRLTSGNPWRALS